MARYSNHGIIQAIRNGQEDVLFYISKKYFQQARRIIRRKGFRDQDSPMIYSDVLVIVVREIQQNNLSDNIDFEKLLFNHLREFILENKKSNDELSVMEENRQAAINCFSILDDQSKKILSERYSYLHSFEQISSRLNFSNPLIAEFEFNRAYSLFENVVKARLSIN
jgi:hypothetical protein